MSTFKRVFAITAGVTVGAVFAIAALIWVWSIWEDRARVRDANAVGSRYLGLGISFPKEGSPVLEAEVGLTNQTHNDLRVSRHSIQVFVRTRDGSMRTVAQSEGFPDELFLPTKEEVAFTLPIRLGESIDYKCKTPGDVDNTGSPEFSKFLESCLNKIAGVTLFLESPEMMRVDFAIPTTKAGNNGEAKAAEGDTPSQ